MRAVSRALLPFGLVALVALAGCGAGQQAQTSGHLANVNGANSRSGEMLLRDAVFVFQAPVSGDSVYEVGDDPLLQFTVVNDGAFADRLVDVRSDVARGSVIAGDTAIPGRHVLTAGYTESLADIELPDTTEVTVRLTDLTQPLRAGLTYPVIFEFQHAAPLRAQIPIDSPDAPRAPAEASQAVNPGAAPRLG